GELVESIPGRIRVQLPSARDVAPTGSGLGLLSAFGLGRAETTRAPGTQVELRMEKRDGGHQSRLHITVILKPEAGRTQAAHFGPVEVVLAAVASRTGVRGAKYKEALRDRVADFANHAGPDAGARLVAGGVDAVCVATPDDRHFDAARTTLAAGKHVLVEKPS